MEPWLRPFLARQLMPARPHHDGRCVRLQIFHLAGKQRGVKTWDFPEAVQESEIDNIGHDIVESAQADAASLFGRQRYSLCAYYERRPEVAAESKVFVRDGGGEDEDDDVDSEGPNQRGLLTQLMRHNESNARSLVQSVQGIIRSQGEIIQTQTQRLHQLEAGHIQSVQVYESLLSERHIREIASKEHDLKMRVWAEGFDRVQLLLPVIVNKLAGARIMPEPASAQSEMIGGLLDSITPEEVQKIGGILRPEQMIVILNMIEDRRKQVERLRADSAAKQAALTTAAGASGNGTEAKPQ